MIFLGDERYYSQMCFGLISRRWFEQKVAQWQEKNRRVSFYLKINIFVAKKHKYVNLNAKKACLGSF